MNSFAFFGLATPRVIIRFAGFGFDDSRLKTALNKQPPQRLHEIRSKGRCKYFPNLVLVVQLAVSGEHINTVKHTLGKWTKDLTAQYRWQKLNRNGK